MNQETLQNVLAGVTLGLGIDLGGIFTLDYAIDQPAADWGFSHVVALTWNWGEASRLRPAAAPAQETMPPKAAAAILTSEPEGAPHIKPATEPAKAAAPIKPAANPKPKAARKKK